MASEEGLLTDWESELKRQQTLKKQAVQLGIAEQERPVDRTDFYMNKQISLLTTIKDKEDNIAQLEDEIRTHKVHIQRIRDLDAEEKYNAKRPWDTTGYSVLPYRDPHPTGLSKRTPTGGFFSS